MIHEEKGGYCYRSANEASLSAWAVLKYFTDADVKDMKAGEVPLLHDALLRGNEFSDIMDYIHEGYWDMWQMYRNTCDMIEKRCAALKPKNILNALDGDGDPKKLLDEMNLLNEWLLAVTEKAGGADAAVKDAGALAGLDKLMENGMVSFAKRK